MSLGLSTRVGIPPLLHRAFASPEGPLRGVWQNGIARMSVHGKTDAAEFTAGALNSLTSSVGIRLRLASGVFSSRPSRSRRCMMLLPLRVGTVEAHCTPASNDH